EAYAADTDPTDMELYIRQNFTLDKIYNDLNNEKVKYYIAINDTQCAGYACVRWDRTHELLHDTKALMLHRIYLIKAFWGQQVGSLLLQQVINFAKSAGYEWLWLVVWEENRQALRFYEKWGFEHFGYEDFQYGSIVTQDWAMRKHVL
ncbi:MAG: GNAT family N-acetyltransferase, partial [Saprospiraceae bacterium]